MANIVYRQMPTPRELPQQVPVPSSKSLDAKPQDRGKFLVQIPARARGVVMDETDTCINVNNEFLALPCTVLSIREGSAVCVPNMNTAA